MRALTLLAICLFAFGSIGHVSAGAELKVGDPAPDFTLKASNGRTYKVSDFRNKQAIVLAWFPKAYTRGCTLECKSLAEHGDRLKEYDVAYFTVSVDPLDENRATTDHFAYQPGGGLVITEHPEGIDFDGSSDQLWSLD